MWAIHGQVPGTHRFVFVVNVFGMGEFQLAQYYFGGIGIPPSQLLFLLIMPLGWVSSNSPNVILGGIGIPPSQYYFRWNQNSAILFVILGGIGIPPSPKNISAIHRQVARHTPVRFC